MGEQLYDASLRGITKTQQLNCTTKIENHAIHINGKRTAKAEVRPGKSYVFPHLVSIQVGEQFHDASLRGV